ncbi:beta-galactosidase 5-like [Rosa chinensis]|uniref:beta-galactosidase 5-like n=1 Tax=Rosa chinensis TaxID=74649 RepID=UPI000D08991D|nr:beta-galactosidase 5-like [Rosa chinensis]
MNLSSSTSTSVVNWTRVSLRTQNQQPLTWYKCYLNPQANFDALEGDEPLALEMGSIGKGEVRIALEDTGLFLLLVTVALKLFWYHVPRSWLKPSQNLLVVFEELAGDVTKIDLLKITHVLRNGRPRTEAN